MGAKPMIQLHNKLCLAKSSEKSVIFGGFNIIFIRDFLQLPSISSYHLYTNKPLYQLGHHLWQSLNAAVILETQMRQINDRRYAELLHRLRIRKPTDEDIAIIKSRIGAPIANAEYVPIIVRRNELRHKLNNKMIHRTAAALNKSILYCVANIKSSNGIKRQSAYALRYGHKKVPGDLSCRAYLSW